MTQSEEADGLLSLIRFALMASGADLMVAFEADADGFATPLAASPATIADRFRLRTSRLLDIDWSDGQPRDTAGLRLPSALLHALGRPAKQILLIPTPVDYAPGSGLILLWGANGPWQCECPFRSGMQSGIPLLAQTFAQMLKVRREERQRSMMQDRFQDLFESVAAGIVVLEGDGRSGLVNGRAAEMLRVSPGRHDAGDLVAPMRALRETCVNRGELEAIFQALIANVDFAAVTVWDFGDRQIEVDTHPVRGDGRKGRLWMFHDVTAERKLEAELRAMALTDTLTGLANRRHFEARGDAEIAALRKTGKPLALLMIDIDHFKAINDTHGHPVGDEVLKAVAARCRGALRDEDMVARLGGEEFVVLLPGTDVAEAAAIAERLREAIASVPVMAGSAVIEVHASLGGAMAGPPPETIDTLLDRADAALYRAKTGGRNRVIFDAAPTTG
ncbi:MAG: hypothetical protein JWR77_1337 [Rhizorhabdus sp.]|nr:hypothetical protein [Rhizorhabdus sp.]